MRQQADPQVAAVLRRFFKTGPGEYAAGDLFLGLKVPQTRAYLPQCKHYSLEELLELLSSPYHEERLLALLAMVKLYPRKPDDVCQAYLRNTRFVNNWDLVDSSAPGILGAWLLPRQERDLLDQLSRSGDLWERRISVLATQTLLSRGQFEDTLRICRCLLQDPHDLIHKACGWMLREVGKREIGILLQFLEEHAGSMPRTMLRYSLEKLPEWQRQHYMRNFGRVKA